MLEPGIVSAALLSVANSLKFDVVPMMFSMAADGTLRAVEPSGKSSMARR